MDIPRKVQYQRSTADAYVTGSETDYRYEDGDEGKGIDLSSEYEYEEDVLPTNNDVHVSSGIDSSPPGNGYLRPMENECAY